MKTFSFKKPVYSALIFFGTLIVLSVAYALYQTIDPADYASGKTLSSALMGKIVGNIDDLNTRMSGITTSTGQIRPEVLPFKKGQIVGDGSVQINDVTSNSTVSYYRVDGLVTNKALIHPSVTWGDGNSQNGTMNIGNSFTGTNGSKTVSIPAWYYDGSKTVTAVDTNLVAGNIASGVSVFWVSGTYSGSGPQWRYTPAGQTPNTTCASYGWPVITPIHAWCMVDCAVCTYASEVPCTQGAWVGSTYYHLCKN